MKSSFPWRRVLVAIGVLVALVAGVNVVASTLAGRAGGGSWVSSIGGAVAATVSGATGAVVSTTSSAAAYVADTVTGWAESFSKWWNS